MIQENKKWYLEKYTKIFKDNGYDISFDGDLVKIHGNDLQIVGDSVNTFWTAEGVLCSKDYDFVSMDNFVMIDIGLNIGITSLHMAKNKNIIQIYGFEPFKKTFEQAERNLKNNISLSDKISIYNYGLGNKNEILSFDYNSDLPGSMSTTVDRFIGKGNREIVEIKNASSVLSEIFDKHNEKFFLKIDCEGAEFDIIEDLGSTGLLSKIDVICLEWHFKDPQVIIDTLRKDKFIIFSSETLKKELGFIRAVKIDYEK